MRLGLSTFGGMRPMVQSEDLPAGLAVLCRDAKVQSGALVPWHESSVVEAASVGDKGLYKWSYVEHTLTCATAGNSTASEWVALSEPAFMLSLDGTDLEISPDFSGASTMADIAEDIQDAVRAETSQYERVVWDTDHFVIYTNGTVLALDAPDTGGTADISGSSWMNGLEAAAIVDNSDKSDWITWAEPVNVVKSAVASDQFSRIYWTGEDKPKVKGYDAGVVKTRDIEIPAPDSAPTIEAVPIFNPTGVSIAGAFSGSASFSADTNGEITFSYTTDNTFFQSHENGGTLPTDKIKIAVVTSKGTIYLPEMYWFVIAESANRSALIDGWMDTIGTTELEDSATGSKLKLTGSVTVSLVSWASVQDGGSSTGGITGWYCTFRVSGTLQMAGTYPTAPAKASRRVLYCYVTDWGEEGPTSEFSQMIDVPRGNNIQITSDTTIPDGFSTRGIVKKRFYMTSSDQTWRFLMDADYDEETTLAIKGDEQLGEELEGATEGPADDLSGLISIPGGYFAAFRKNEVWFSRAYRPEAWPADYRFTVHDTIIGLGSSMNEVFVVTERSPWLLTGSDPKFITQARIMHDDRGLSGRSIKQVRGMVLSSGPDGLTMFQGGSAGMATGGIVDSKSWATYLPDQLHAVSHDGSYIAFNTAKGIVFESGVDGAFFGELSGAGVTALYRDDETDYLYAIDGSGNIVLLDDSEEDCKTFVWKSGDLIPSRPVRFVAVKVRAASYSGTTITLKLYGDGELVDTITITGQRSVKIATHSRRERWAFQIEANTTVYEVAVGTSTAEVRNSPSG